MAGKNKIERGFRVWYDDTGGTARDLSGDLVPGSVSIGGGLRYTQVDMTGVSDGVMNYLAGHPEASIQMTFHQNDTATTGAFTVIKAQNGTNGSTGYTLTNQWGSSGAAPTTGDPEWEGEYGCFMGPIRFDGGRAVFDVTFQPNTGTAPAWGTVS